LADFKKLISLITSTVDGFNNTIPGIQKKMLDELLLLTKKLDIKGENIAISGANIKLLTQLQSKLQNIILNPNYVNGVKEYVNSFNDVVNIQHDYFTEITEKFKPPKLSSELKKQAIIGVVNNLTENGLNANVIDKVKDILRKSITTGGSYSSLSQSLTNFIIDNKSGEGQLVKYTKQITTDALNQFSGQYTQLISSDLGYEWFRYSGSNIETTRPFCLACTERKYFHISELPNVLKGKFQEFVKYNGAVNPKTDLPYGFIPNTDVSNFMINRGGYNCGHQWRPVSEDLVPMEHQYRVKSTLDYHNWALANNREVEPIKAQETKDVKVEPTIKEKVLEKNKDILKKIEAKGYVMDNELLDSLGDEISFTTMRKSGAHYLHSTKTISIGSNPDRMKSEYFKQTVLPHEIGHAIHSAKGIIEKGVVSEDFANHFAKLKTKISGKEKEINELIYSKIKENRNNENNLEQLYVIYDILGSLTKGRYGGGHTKSYYNRPTGGQVEIFAHSVSLFKVKNDFESISTEIADVIREMKAYISKVL
jgi:hypothetical protein